MGTTVDLNLEVDGVETDDFVSEGLLEPSSGGGGDASRFPDDGITIDCENFLCDDAIDDGITNGRGEGR